MEKRTTECHLGIKNISGNYKMPCPICTGALISTVAQSAAAVSLVKHVKDRSTKKPKSKGSQLKKKSK